MTRDEWDQQNNAVWVAAYKDAFPRKSLQEQLDDRLALEQLRAQVAALREAMYGLLNFFRGENETSFDLFERQAEAFHKETGYVAPGKDCRVHDYEFRKKAWEAWASRKARQSIASLTDTSAVAKDHDARVWNAAIDAAIESMNDNFWTDPWPWIRNTLIDQFMRLKREIGE